MIHKLIGDSKIVPVIMFHSVGLEHTQWNKSYLSEPIDNFESKVRALSMAGYNFIHWSELFDYMSGKNAFDRPAVMLTLDDGYLDNWVFAFPILKKYGAKATIFINPEFVDPSNTVRPNLNDIWDGSGNEADLKTEGFLNWPEMKKMEESTLFDIQSHGLTHTWYFCSPRIVDFHSPGNNDYPWMAWNQRPDLKPFYMSNDQSEHVPAGTPIYAHEKALICKRYFPPSEIAQKITAFIAENGENSFFEDRRWKDELEKITIGLHTQYKSLERYESHEEYLERVYNELAMSKQIIEHKLDKQVEYICWPGGAYNNEIKKLAKKAGYKAWTLGSQDQSTRKNIAGAPPYQIKRIGSYNTREIFWGRRLNFPSGQDFLFTVKRHQNSWFFKNLGRIKKIFRWLVSFFETRNRYYHTRR